VLDTLAADDADIDDLMQSVVRQLTRNGTLGAALAKIQCVGVARRLVFRCGEHRYSEGSKMAIVCNDGRFPQLMTVVGSEEVGSWRELYMNNPSCPCTADCATVGEVCPIELLSWDLTVLGTWRSVAAVLPALTGESTVHSAVNYLCALRYSRSVPGQPLRWTVTDLQPYDEPGSVIRAWCAPIRGFDVPSEEHLFDRVFACMYGRWKDIPELMAYSG
jgi:hypothetical protein